MGCQELTHPIGNHVPVFFKSKVPCIEQVKLDIVQISLIGFGSLRREDNIVLALYHKRRWLVLAQRSLLCRVGRNIGLIVIEHG